MSGGAPNVVQLKFKKINTNDLKFDTGVDSFNARGQFGDVRKAKWNDLVVAVKTFTGGADRKCGFKEEVLSLSLLQPHEHIVTLHGANNMDPPFIVLEFAPLSLEKVLHECKKMYSYTSDHVMSWSLQTAKGLEYIHSKKMLHRDIKPSNILLFHHGKQLKLCDFGTAKKLETTLSMTNAVGTIRYMAPEVIKGKRYSIQCDIFSYGIVLWEMLSRRRPMPSRGNHYQIMFAMAQGQVPAKIVNIPKPMSELIDKCFSLDPQSRPPISEIRKKLEYLSQFVKPVTPLIPRRQGKPADPRPTQSDVFAADRQGTQQTNRPSRVCADSALDNDEKPAKVQEIDESALRRDEVKVTPVRPGSSSKRDTEQSPQQLQRTEEEGGVRFSIEGDEGELGRDRSQTVPNRENIRTEASGRNPVLQTQASSPATDTPHKYLTTPRNRKNLVPADGSMTVGRRSGRGYGREESEYEEMFVSGEILSDNSLEVQSERYQMIEEVMKRTTNFPVADVSSQYSIPGLEPQLQPIIPNENNPQSMELHRQYSEVAEDILKARKEYDELMDENVKLAREIETDKQKAAKQKELYYEYEKQCKLKDQLLSEYSTLDQQYKSLREKNSTAPPN